jgi:hypothetical protein
MNVNVTVDQIGGHVKREVEVFKTTPLSKKSLLSKPILDLTIPIFEPFCLMAASLMLNLQ